MSAAQVLPQTAATLDWVSQYNGGKPLYIDQFLFTDNTPGFEENPKLDEAEMPVYLTQCASVLKEKTMGYGIWTYRDYGNNMIYNSQFALGKEGWMSSGRTQSGKQRWIQSVGNRKLWPDFPDRKSGRKRD